MSAQGLNRIAKILAFVGGVAIFFAIAMLWAFAAGGPCDAASPLAGSSLCGGFYNTADFLVGAVSLTIGVVGIAVAVSIRRRLGGPLVGPWRGFN